MARPFNFFATFSEDLKFPHRISDSKPKEKGERSDKREYRKYRECRECRGCREGPLDT